MPNAMFCLPVLYLSVGCSYCWAQAYRASHHPLGSAGKVVVLLLASWAWPPGCLVYEGWYEGTVRNIPCEKRRQIAKPWNSVVYLAHLEAWQIEFIAMTQGPNPVSTKVLRLGRKTQAQGRPPAVVRRQGLAGRRPQGWGVSSRSAGSSFRCP